MTFEKLVKVTNIGSSTEHDCDKKMEEMKEIKHASLTQDNCNILTIETDNDFDAYIRSYILDEDKAE